MTASMLERWTVSVGTGAALLAAGLWWWSLRVRVDPGWRSRKPDLDPDEARISAIVEAGVGMRRLDTWAITSLVVSAIAICAGCGLRLMR